MAQRVPIWGPKWELSFPSAGAKVALAAPFQGGERQTRQIFASGLMWYVLEIELLIVIARKALHIQPLALHLNR